MSTNLIDEAISLGHRADTAATFLREGCALLQRAIGADALLGILQGEAAWTAEHVKGVTPEIMQRLTSRWTTYRSELGSVFEVARSAGVAIDVNVLGASLESSSYYREIMDPQRAKAGAILMLTQRKSALGAFVLGRRSRFSKREETELGKIAPALALGLAALRAWRPRNAEPVPCARPSESGLIGPSWVLSRREREFVDYVCLGYSNKQIALACGISPNTVRNRLAAVYERLGVSTRAELASLVARPAGSSR